MSFRHIAIINIGIALAALLAVGMPSGAAGQDSTYPRMPGMAGSTNVEVLSHITLGTGDVSDIEVEQDEDRPYAYVTRRMGGFDVVSLEDPENAEVIFSWTVENVELHQGGGSDTKYFKHDGRYYLV